MMASTTGSVPTTVTRFTEFVKTNRRVLLISLSIAIAVAAGSIYLTSDPSKGDSYSNQKTKKNKKDVKKSSKKLRKKSSKNLSNLHQKTSDLPSSHTSGSIKNQDEKQFDPINLTKEEIEALPAEEKARYAFILKTNGNQAYQSKSYEKAIEYYTRAIECEQKAVYFSNRAACYTYLNDPEAVIRDCTEALRLDKHYIKALNRRAAARELMGGEENLFLALCDFTACVILDEFKTDSKGATADRVMKRYATEKAKSIIQGRGPKLPSNMIIRAYLDAFRKKPRPSLPEEPNQADKTLMMAYDALDNFDYNHSCSLFHEAVEQVPSTKELRAHGSLMKATFLFLMGMSEAAVKEFDQTLLEEPNMIQAWIRKASVNMELGSIERAMEDFEEAIKLDPNDPDVYYHRGQVYNVTEQHELSIKDYQKSIELDSNFIFSHVQLAVAIYKSGDSSKAMDLFKKYLDQNTDQSNSPEVHNYFGELLFAEQKFDEALDRFDSAIQLEENRNGPKNVLPWVNKALVYATARSDIEKATESCMKALEIDSNCEVAIQHLAQFKLQSNQIQDALKWYEKGIEVAMTEVGLAQFIQFHVAAKAQLAFMTNYPEFAAKLGLQ